MQVVGRHSSNYEKAEDVVFNTIARSYRAPISKKELLDIVAPLEQSTIYRITKKLEKKGLIKIIRNGQRTSYIALKVPQRDKAIEGFLFGNRFVNIVLGKDRLISFDPPIEDPKFKIKIDHPEYENNLDFKRYRRYFKTVFNYGSLEDKIFEFVNQIGAYIVTVFLNAMDHDKLSKAQAEESKDTSGLVMSYIRNAIGSQLLQIFQRFCIEVNRWIRNNDPVRSISKRFPQQSELQRQSEMGLLLDAQTTAEIGKIISRMYPRLTKRLANINSRITEEKILWYTNKHLQKLEREPSKCNHHLNIKWRKRKRKSKIDNRGKIIEWGRCPECKQLLTRTRTKDRNNSEKTT